MSDNNNNNNDQSQNSSHGGGAQEGLRPSAPMSAEQRAAESGVRSAQQVEHTAATSRFVKGREEEAAGYGNLGEKRYDLTPEEANRLMTEKLAREAATAGGGRK